MVIRRLPSSNTASELYHHGILGQKWGIENGPPYPLGSKISTGKRIIKRNGTVKTKNNTIQSDKKEIVITKETTTESNKGSKETYKEFHINKKYLAMAGAALAVAAGVSLAVGVYKYKHNINAKMLYNTTLENTHFQRFSKGMGDAPSVYASFDPTDKKTYWSYGAMMQRNQNRRYIKENGIVNYLMNRDNLSIYKKDYIGKTVNIPSVNESSQIFKNVFKKNPGLRSNFKEIVNNQLDEYVKYNNKRKGRTELFKEVSAILDKKHISDSDYVKLYEAWNCTAGFGRKETNWNEYSKVYNAFKNKGYNVIWDVHDLKYSGLRTKSPAIIIDTSSFDTTAINRVKSSKLKMKTISRLIPQKIGMDSIIAPLADIKLLKK